jgi:hypothetical protein
MAQFQPQQDDSRAAWPTLTTSWPNGVWLWRPASAMAWPTAFGPAFSGFPAQHTVKLQPWHLEEARVALAHLISHRRWLGVMPRPLEGRGGWSHPVFEGLEPDPSLSYASNGDGAHCGCGDTAGWLWCGGGHRSGSRGAQLEGGGGSVCLGSDQVVVQWRWLGDPMAWVRPETIEEEWCSG